MVRAQTHTGKGPRFWVVSTDVRFGSLADTLRCDSHVRLPWRGFFLAAVVVTTFFCTVQTTAASSGT